MEVVPQRGTPRERNNVTATYANRESCIAYDHSCPSCRLSLVLPASILIGALFVFSGRPLAAQVNAHANAKTQPPAQRFACNVGYTPEECLQAETVLKKALARYPVEELGEWKWVLVRTEDWKQILSVRGFETNHPAFSYLPKRETFVDGALVVRRSIRGAELSAIWRMPVEDLLDLAIRHELAHALCNEYDESKTDRAATALKNGAPLPCRVIEQVSTANPK